MEGKGIKGKGKGTERDKKKGESIGETDKGNEWRKK